MERGAYCTFAATAAVSLIVNVQLRVLFPPLEHAPDQTASRPLLTLSVMAVPAANDAVPLLPTETLIPAGFDVTRSPLRPDAVTDSGTVGPGGAAAGSTVRVALRIALP